MAYSVDRVDEEAAFHWRRIERLQLRLREAEVDVAVLMAPVNIYYFTGTAQRGALIVPSSGEPALYVVRSYERALQEACVKCVRASGLGEVVEGLKGFKRVGLEEDLLPVKLHRRLLGEAVGFDVSGVVMELRMAKDELEQRLLREAARQCDAVFERAPEVLKEGAAALEVAAELEKVLREVGHDGYLDMHSWGDHMPNIVVLPPGDLKPSRLVAVSVGSGVSPACPVGPSRAKLRRGDVVWIDTSGRFKGYTADVTRTFVLGRPSVEVVEAFKAIAEVQRQLIKGLRTGVDAGTAYRKAVELASELGIEEGFMGRGEGKVGFIGHGVGLEIDEPPVISERGGRLVDGAALAIEPKYVSPGGWGVGLESTTLLSGGGCEALDKAPVELIEV